MPAGLYPENVVVTKSLTIKGAFAGTSGFTASRNGTREAIIKPASGLAVSVKANDVTFDGFTINGVSTAGLFSGGYANGQVLNNRFMDSTTNGLYIENGSVASMNWLVQGNLFENISGATSTAIRLTRVDGIRVVDNAVRNVGYQGIQLSVTAGAEIRRNKISDTQRDGINIATSSGVVISDNTITDINQADGSDRGAIRLYDSATGIEAYCNIIDAQRGGIALRAGTLGAGGVHLYDNKVIGNAVSGARFIANGWSAGVDIGSNWYDGIPFAAGAEASSARLADALAADPIGNAACGDNSPVQIVAHSGSGQSTTINTVFANPLNARVVDALGGAVKGKTVSFAAPSGGPSASVATLTSITNYNGILRATATANPIAGSYSVVAKSGTLVDASFALTNTKLPATITLDAANLIAVFDGSSRVVTAVTAPAGLAYNVMYEGNTMAPTDAGSYVVVATIDDANYTGSTTDTLVVSPASAMVSLSSLVQPFDGTPKSVVVTTNPAGLPTAVTHDGNSAPPSAVGAYLVTATVNHPNYSGTTTGVLRIVQDLVAQVIGPISGVLVEEPTEYLSSLTNNGLALPENVLLTALLTSNVPGGIQAGDVTVEYFDGSGYQTLPLNMTSAGLEATFGPPGVGFAIPAGYSATTPLRLTYHRAGIYTSTSKVSGVNSGVLYASGSMSTSVIDQPTNVSLLLNGPLTGVHVDAPTQYSATLINDGLALAENVRVHILLTSDVSGGIQDGDVTVEYYTGSTYLPLTLVLTANGLETDFGAPIGFPVGAGYSATTPMRFTYHRSGNYSAAASVIGVDTGTDYADSSASTSVVAQSLALAVSITDGREYAQYGYPLSYGIVVSNTGNVDLTGVAVNDILPAILLPASGNNWRCYAGGNSSCSPLSGSGDVSTLVDIPANGSVTIILDAAVNEDQNLTTDLIENTVTASVTVAGQNYGGTATDSTQAVIFRDGFELNGDGAQVPTSVIVINDVASLGGDHIQMLDLRSTWASNDEMVELARMRTDSGDQLRVEAFRVGDVQLVRLAGQVNGKQQASAWSTIQAATTQLALGLAEVDGQRALLLIGGDTDLQLPLSAGAATLQVWGPSATND